MSTLLSNVLIDGDGAVFGGCGEHTEARHFSLMMACAEICRTSAHFMLIGSELHKRTCRLCGEICDQCAADCERVLRQYERGVVFLLGKFEGVRGPGFTLIFVPIQQMVRVSLRTVTMQIPSQKIITKDNVSIDIAAVAYYHISDPEKAV
jgi:hypothetical protein